MCSACVAPIFGFIRWLFVQLCTFISFLYSHDRVLAIHAIITYLGFVLTFVLSRYWDILMGIHVVENPPLGCCQCLAPVPPPATTYHSSILLHLWQSYHSVFLETLYYLAFALIAFAETLLVKNWGSDSLNRIREALAHCSTLGQLRKSVIEISLLRLIVFLGDIFCDPSHVDLLIFLTFVFAYLHFASVFKLIGIGSDFGWLDGLVSLILAAFEHFVRPWSLMQFFGILLTAIVVCYKNTMWSGQGQRLQQGGSEEEGRSLTEMTPPQESQLA